MRPLAKAASMMEKILYPVSRWLSYVSMGAAAAMMLMVTADVFMRRFFNAPISGAYEIVRILLIIVVFCAVAYVISVKGHVIVDSVTRLYPRKLKLAVTGIAQILSMAVLGLLCWQTTVYGMAMMRVGENMILLKIPVAPFVFIVAFGCALFLLVILVQFVFTLAGVSDEDTGQPVSSAERDYGQR